MFSSYPTYLSYLVVNSMRSWDNPPTSGSDDWNSASWALRQTSCWTWVQPWSFNESSHHSYSNGPQFDEILAVSKNSDIFGYPKSMFNTSFFHIFPMKIAINCGPNCGPISQTQTHRNFAFLLQTGPTLYGWHRGTITAKVVVNHSL